MKSAKQEESNPKALLPHAPLIRLPSRLLRARAPPGRMQPKVVLGAYPLGKSVPMPNAGIDSITQEVHLPEDTVQ